MFDLNLQNQFKNYGTLDKPVVCIKDAIKLENVGKDTVYRKINNSNLKTVTIKINTKNQHSGRGVYITDLSVEAQRRYYESLKSGIDRNNKTIDIWLL